MLGYFILIDSTKELRKSTSPIPGNAFRRVNRKRKISSKGKKNLMLLLTLKRSLSRRVIIGCYGFAIFGKSLWSEFEDFLYLFYLG